MRQWLLHPYFGRLSAFVGEDRHRNRTDTLLKHNRLFFAELAERAEPRQGVGAADGGMARHREFGGRREDAQLEIIGGVGGRKDESRFGQVQLFGDLLHQFGRKILWWIGKDGQLIAAELTLREYIKQVIVQAHDFLDSPFWALSARICL